MASRDLNDLQPEVRRKAERFLSLSAAAHLDILIYCTLREPREQAILFRQGRELQDIEARAEQLAHDYQRPDLAALLIEVGPQSETRIVTWSGPGQSLHNYGLAFDGVPLHHGKPVWGGKTVEDRELWTHYGDLGESVGLQWAGRWPRGRTEFPHLQDRGANWRELIRKAA
jgi:peptidoglycan L-alanyl-D-glutamate endopeptidase CwlK